MAKMKRKVAARLLNTEYFIIVSCDDEIAERIERIEGVLTVGIKLPDGTRNVLADERYDAEEVLQEILALNDVATLEELLDGQATTH